MASFRHYRPPQQISNFERAIQLANGDLSQVKDQFAALNDGFKSVQDRAVNRLLRDSFETKLSSMGITDYNAAYSQLSGGQSLTSNATLLNMINNVGSVAPQQPTNTGNTGSDGGGSGGGGAYDPGEGGGAAMPMIIQADPKQEVGGPGSVLDGGATGFRRKRSSARMAGLTNKGTSQLKITGQTSKSSGLNIG